MSFVFGGNGGINRERVGGEGVFVDVCSARPVVEMMRNKLGILLLWSFCEGIGIGIVGAI